MLHQDDGLRPGVHCLLSGSSLRVIVVIGGHCGKYMVLVEAKCYNGPVLCIRHSLFFQDDVSKPPGVTRLLVLGAKIFCVVVWVGLEKYSLRLRGFSIDKSHLHTT